MEKVKNLGKEFVKKGLPEIGKSLIKIAGRAISKHPVGSILDDIGVLDSIGDALGVDSSPESIEKTIQNKTPEELQALTKLKELESNIAIAEIEERIKISEHRKDETSSVNETIRAEVLANPESGAWRPLWGRWSCYNFFPTTYILIIILGYATITKQFDIIANFPSIVGSIALLWGLPAAILGVASWGRSGERKELAKNLTKKE